jgi:AcrR family transcriptional regulator
MNGAMAARLENQYGQRIGAKGHRTRQRLIDETIALLESRGLRDLTVAEVARNAETSPATFYVYFEGVPEVLLAALEQAGGWADELVALLDQPWPDAEARANVARLVDLYCAAWGRYRTVFRVRNLASEEGDARFFEARTTAVVQILDLLAAKVRAAQQAGREPSNLHPNSVAGAVLMLLERLAAVGPVSPTKGGVTFAALREAASHMVAHALGVE